MASFPVGRKEELTANEVLQRLHSNQIRAQHQVARARESASRCTYDQGYVGQALYVCLTCTPEQKGVPAGICLACSLSCHLDHEVSELFVKRSFRCDCGNSNFKESAQATCTLAPSKDDENRDNRYNHNFFGHYCTCNSAYDESKDTMLQCVRCQDWFHDTCLGATDADTDLDLLCSDCVKSSPFLAVYLAHLTQSSESNAWVVSPELSRGHGAGVQPDVCTRPDQEPRDAHNGAQRSGHVFLPEEFIACICRCKLCLERMKEQQLLCLVEDDEVVSNQLELFDENIDDGVPQQLDPEFDTDAMLNRALQRMERTAAIDGIRKFQHFVEGFKAGFGALLKSDPTHVVTKEDVENILSKSQAGSVLGKRSR